MSDQSCRTMRAAMLSAELSELQGRGPSEVAAHVRECASCRAAAQRILFANSRLAAQLEQASGTKHTATTSAWPVWLALPIAAALAGLFFLQQHRLQLEAIPRVGRLEDVRRPVATPVVNAPANRDVAVFRTAENITVVWDLGTKEGS